jgi:hypothetical protein
MGIYAQFPIIYGIYYFHALKSPKLQTIALDALDILCLSALALLFLSLCPFVHVLNQQLLILSDPSSFPGVLAVEMAESHDKAEEL